MTVVVNAAPTATVTASGSTTFCKGGSTVLTAVSGTAVLYQWFRNGVAVTAATATGTTYTATTSGSYTVVVTNSLSCTGSSAAVVITVNAPPTTVTASGSTAFCTGGSVTFQGPTATGLTYQWYMNAAVITGATTSSYTATTAGDYYLEVTDVATGCVDTSAHFNVTIGAGPSAAITPSPSVTICAGNTTTLSTNTAPGLTYQWNLNGSPVGTGGTSYNYTTGVGGSYTVTVAFASNPSCYTTTTTPTVITVNPLPTATITATTATTFCQGDSVTLSANTGTGLSYQWNLNGTPVGSGGATGTYVARLNGNYTVTVTNTATGCSKVSSPFTVNVNPAPPITINASDLLPSAREIL